MDKINAGMLRTKIRIQKQVKVGSGSFAEKKWVDLDETPAENPPNKYTRSYWYPLGGAETWAAQAVQVINAANVIIRYNPAVTSLCRVVCDGVVYNIVAPNDPDQHKHWLKFKVKAAVNG